METDISGQKDIATDKLSVKEYEDPFEDREVRKQNKK